MISRSSIPSSLALLRWAVGGQQRCMSVMTASARPARFPSPSSLTATAQRALSSFAGLEADEIMRELRQLKQQQDEAEQKALATTDASPSSSSSSSSISKPPAGPAGGPSVDAILRLRRTNRKVDADEVSNRFQKAMEYRKQRQHSKGDGKQEGGAHEAAA